MLIAVPPSDVILPYANRVLRGEEGGEGGRDEGKRNKRTEEGEQGERKGRGIEWLRYLGNGGIFVWHVSRQTRVRHKA